MPRYRKVRKVLKKQEPQVTKLRIKQTMPLEHQATSASETPEPRAFNRRAKSVYDSQEQIQEVNQMIQNRETFRAEKNFVEADKIRDKLNEMKIELIDHKGKTIWMKKEKIKADL